MEIRIQTGRQQVVEEFHRLYAQAKRRQFWSRLTGHSTALHCLRNDLAEKHALPRSQGGIQLIPLAQIQGSEGRCGDFDAEFRPLQPHNKDRWVNVAMAFTGDAGLPPVQLVKVGDLYYVRDGHHRISVAHTFGHQEIEAEVTVLDQ